MIFSRDMLLLYAVTECITKKEEEDGLCKKIEHALQGGVTLLQLRQKKLDESSFVKLAIRVGSICRAYNVPLIINDNLNVALKSKASGVHVGDSDLSVSLVRKTAGENFIVGATAKTVERAQSCEIQGANYLGVGAVFSSPTKKEALRVSVDALKNICESVSIPIAAIGGITKENMGLLKGSGISGVAVVSSLFSAPDVNEAARNLKAEARKTVADNAQSSYQRS